MLKLIPLVIMIASHGTYLCNAECIFPWVAPATDSPCYQVGPSTQDYHAADLVKIYCCFIILQSFNFLKVYYKNSLRHLHLISCNSSASKQEEPLPNQNRQLKLDTFEAFSHLHLSIGQVILVMSIIKLISQVYETCIIISKLIQIPRTL